jgi:hypothetical protein
MKRLRPGVPGWIHVWDAQQVAVHRGRFEARGVGAQAVPF